MTQYVLVHGGDRDGSIWNPIAESLREQGHIVFCPSMESVTKTSLANNIEQIVELIQSNALKNVILIGHSYGSMVITGVNDRIPNQIKQLGFVDSVVPRNGQSLYGLLNTFGLNYQSFGLTPDRACLDPLFFDEQLLAQKSKFYIHCLQSEFLAALKIVYADVVKNRKKAHWSIFCLDTTHGCMFTYPNELAIIFAGLSN